MPPPTRRKRLYTPRKPRMRGGKRMPAAREAAAYTIAFRRSSMPPPSCRCRPGSLTARLSWSTPMDCRPSICCAPGGTTMLPCSAPSTRSSLMLYAGNKPRQGLPHLRADHEAPAAHPTDHPSHVCRCWMNGRGTKQCSDGENEARHIIGSMPRCDCLAEVDIQ
jgi:hypothetical protein